MKSGHFKLVIKPKRIIYVSMMDNGISNESISEVFLHFEPTRELQTVSESHNETHVERQSSCITVTWNSEQIDDFVRNLGFLESQTADIDQQIKLFQQLSQVMVKVS